MTPTIFHRTTLGLSNMYRFFRVEAIVFVEGGISRTLDEVHAGAFESESDDVAFWQKCFSELVPAMKVQFRAIGSKPTLRAIALLIAAGSVSRAYVAMDRDFDNHTGDLITCPKVLYTFGYSWENDVWDKVVTEEVFYTLCGVCRVTKAAEIRTIITKAFAGFERDMRWATKADFMCIRYGMALLPHHKPFKVITAAKHGSAPAINRSAVRICIRNAKNLRATGMVGFGSVRLLPLIDCCGHLVGAFGYSVLAYLFKKFCKGSGQSRNVVDMIAIDKLFEKIRQGQFTHLKDHYLQQLMA